MRNRFLKVLLLVVLLASVLMPTFISQPKIVQADGGLQQVIVGGYNDALNYATTAAEYNLLMGGMIWRTDETQAYQLIPTNGSISSLFVELSADPTNAGTSYTFTLMVDGVASALTCTIAAGATTGSDVAHTVTVTTGQTVSLRCVSTADDPATAWARWSTLWTSSIAGESICLMHAGLLSSVAPYWYEIQGFQTQNVGTTEALVQCPMPTNGTFKKFYVKLATAPAATKSYTITLNISGSGGTNTVTIPAGGTTGNSGAATDAVVAGNLVDFCLTSVNAPAVSHAAIGMVFVSNTDGESLIFGGNGYSNPSNAATNYYGFGIFYGPAWNATAANTYSLIQSCTIKNLYVHLTAAPYVNSHTDDWRTISIDKDAGAASGLTVTILDTAKDGNDTVNTYTPANGDTINIKSVPNSSPLASKVHIGMVCYIAPAVSNVYLTTSSSSGGNVSTPAEGTWAYNVSEVVNISATADACYHFVNWTGNTTDIGNVNAISTNISMGSSNKTATANFAINTSTITYTAGANGTLNNSTPQTINCGTNTSWVLASPNACYRFVNWNDSSTMNPRSDVGTSTNQSFTANFAINTSVITYSAGAGGTIVGSTPQTINCGSYTTAVTATANACYRFVNWSDANTSVSRTDLGTSTNQSFTANFAINTSVITYNANAGGSIVGSSPQTINCGASTTSVTATPNACYHFTTWSDANTSAARSDIGTSTNQTFTASFAINVQTVAYASGAGGTVNGSWPENVNCGSDGSWVLATANACYRFVNWDDASTTNPRQETNVTSNISLTANFALNTSIITYNNGANGTIVGTTPQTVNCGTYSTAVTATPNACYHFVNWTEDGNVSATRTDLGTSINQTYTATFAINTSTITYSAGANGTLNNSTPQTINCGSDTTDVEAIPNSCYHFVDWDDSSTDNPRHDTGTSTNQSFTANFAVNVQTVNYSAGSNGVINGSWPQNVNCGSNGAWVEATANSCYHFVNWSDSSTTNPRHEVNVTSNVSYTANFAINIQTVEYIAGSHGSVNGSWPQNVNCGSNGSWVLASPNACYHFENWSDASTTNPRHEVNVTTNVSYTANFNINTYTLTYNAGAGGSIVGSTPQNVNCGSNGTQVTATPNSCYHFTSWSDGVLTASRTELNVVANKTVTANFAINVYILTYGAGANGAINGSSPQNINCGGDGTAITAIPNSCYHFTNWSDASTNNPRTDLNVVANITVVANFAINVSTLTYAAGVGGTINGTSPQNVNCGSNGTAVTAVPDPCFSFLNWSDGKTSNPRTDTNVIANISVTANFNAAIYTLTYTAGAGGTINGTTPQSVDCLQNGSTVTAIPNACYKFVNWSDSIATAARTDLNISANLNVTANFAIITYTLNVSSGDNGDVTTPTEGIHTYNCGQVVNLVATPDWAYNFSVWTGNTTTILDVNDETTTITMNGNYSINCSFVGSLSLFPPTNLIPTLTENASGNTSFWCLNLSWTKGINSPYTIIVICRDEVLSCANKSTTNLSTACMVLYNGNGSSFDIETCGWQIDYYDYTITAWGSDGAGNYSALCANLALGGNKMMDMFGIAIGIAVALVLLGFAFWQKKTWIFYCSGIAWFAIGVISLITYDKATLFWSLGFLYLALTLVCISAGVWLRERKTQEDDPRDVRFKERQEKIDKKKNGY